MSQLYQLLADLISLLDQSGYCENTQILDTAHFSFEQFSFKIRTTIFSCYTLQIKIYFNKGHYDYSYQVFDKGPLLRWDNKEHFPSLKTFPHHFHTRTGDVVESSLRGAPVSDLKVVLEELSRLLGNRNV